MWFLSCYNTWLVNFINVRSCNHAKFNVVFSVLLYFFTKLLRVFLNIYQRHKHTKYSNHDDYLSCIITRNITRFFRHSFYTKIERCCYFAVEIYNFSAIVGQCYNWDAIFHVPIFIVARYDVSGVSIMCVFVYMKFLD